MKTYTYTFDELKNNFASYGFDLVQSGNDRYEILKDGIIIVMHKGDYGYSVNYSPAEKKKFQTIIKIVQKEFNTKNRSNQTDKVSRIIKKNLGIACELSGLYPNSCHISQSSTRMDDKYIYTGAYADINLNKINPDIKYGNKLKVHVKNDYSIDYTINCDDLSIFSFIQDLADKITYNLESTRL